jgi:hypothetical protein
MMDNNSEEKWEALKSSDGIYHIATTPLNVSVEAFNKLFKWQGTATQSQHLWSP